MQTLIVLSMFVHIIDRYTSSSTKHNMYSTTYVCKYGVLVPQILHITQIMHITGAGINKPAVHFIILHLVNIF